MKSIIATSVVFASLVACKGEAPPPYRPSGGSGTVSSGQGGDGTGGNSAGGDGAGASSTGGAGAGGEGTGGKTNNDYGEIGPECYACVIELETTKCADEYALCREQTSCIMWLSCIDDCAQAVNTHACYLACDAEFLFTNTVNQGVKACACIACAATCKSFCTCGK
ncbi:MAG: hypothetical protein EXR75_06755 [Myxococcales bacterium]|nr:hypothetical protein [Myxococcales bacterium]